jgi:hypothetical protein
LSPYRRGGSQIWRPSSRAPAEREGNRIFYIVSEGEATETDYLGSLDAAYGQDLKFVIRMPPRSTRRDGLSPSQVIDEAAQAVDDSDFYQSWGLFDHDRRPDIDQACAIAIRKGVKVALSHPSFELWLLLHFQEFAAAAQGGDNTIIMEKLRTAHPAFADYGKANKRITTVRFAALSEKNRIEHAVVRAKRLSRNFTARLRATEILQRTYIC